MSTAELRAHFVSNMGKMLLLDLITKIHGEIPANSGDCSASLSLSALRFMVGGPFAPTFDLPLQARVEYETRAAVVVR